jgi:hypothetical protein
MTFRALFVLRMKPENADAVARLFAEHDRGDMPHQVGISRRTLFRFHDLYLHLVEADDGFPDRFAEARERPDFKHINRELDGYLERYDPRSWRDLRDSMAAPFYTWSRR